MGVQPSGVSVVTAKGGEKMNKYRELAQRVLGTFLLFMMTIDTLANNWEIMDTLRDGPLFRTPVLKAHNLREVRDSVAFHHGKDPEHLSSTGFWLTEQTIERMINKRGWVYMLEAGTFEMSESTLAQDSSVFAHHTQDYCDDFLGTFPYQEGNEQADIRLGYVRDGVSFIHGYWVNDEHLTIELDPTNYEEKLFSPVRFSTDLRITSYFHPVRGVINATHGMETMFVYRVHSKSFCSGCPGMAEVGVGRCEMEYTVNWEDKTVEVTSSHAPKSSKYRVGVYLDKTATAIVSEILKLVTFVLVATWFMQSRKSYRWNLSALVKETDDSLWKHFKDLMAPKTFNFASHCTNIGMFCINSDLIVCMYSISTMIDEYNSIIYVREVILWQHTDPQFFIAHRRFRGVA